jgi:hypothetical protein
VLIRLPADLRRELMAYFDAIVADASSFSSLEAKGASRSATRVPMGILELRPGVYVLAQSRLAVAMINPLLGSPDNGRAIARQSYSSRRTPFSFLGRGAWGYQEQFERQGSSIRLCDPSE